MDKSVDTPHPFTALEWKACTNPPENLIHGSQSVYMNDKVYVSGRTSIYCEIITRSAASLYIYTPATDEWDKIDTPVYGYALTTYHSQLVLVGGNNCDDGSPSTKLWTLSENGQWQETLPPMKKACFGTFAAVSHGDHLLVLDGIRNEVNVCNGRYWERAEDLPGHLPSLRSTVFNGILYLIRSLSSTNSVFSASLDSLIASCQPVGTSQPSSVWKKLPNITDFLCCPATFGGWLVAAGKLAIYAYSSSSQSWIKLGNTMGHASRHVCSIGLPTNELLVIGQRNMFKASLKVANFNADSNFTMAALSQVNEAGIPLMRSLNMCTQQMLTIFGLDSLSNLDLNTLLHIWLSCGEKAPPTWRNLLQVIRQLHLDDLAQQVEAYLFSGTVRVHSEEGAEGDFKAVSLNLQETAVEWLKKFHSKHYMWGTSQYGDTQGVYSEHHSELKLSDIKQLRSHVLLRERIEEFEAETEIKEEVVRATKAEPNSAEPSASWELRGVEVCGEMTVVVHSSHAQQITWGGFGLKLDIEEGSLPAGVDQCILIIRASLAGQYEFPDNSCLVSSIFWLRCEPACKFTKPVTVEMQHCARREMVNNTKLMFVRAVCSQKQLPYIFKELGGGFSSHSSYGTVEVNSFSGIAITQEGSEDREYCSKLFYLSNYISGYRIDLVITWNTEAHLNVVKKHYKEEGAHSGPDQPIDFDKDEIRLDLPMEGINVTDNTWNIVPLMEPVVTKREVDSYSPGKRIPHCELVANPLGETVSPLMHKVILHGAKLPRNVFTLSYMPPKAYKKLVRLETAMSAKLPIPKLKHLLKELKVVASDWEYIGIELEIEDSNLKQVKSDNPGDSRACLREMLRIWLSGADPRPSWPAVVEALNNLGQIDIAQHIRTKYCVSL